MSDFLGSTDAFMSSIEGDPSLRSTIVVLVLLERSPDWTAVVRRFDLLTQKVPIFRRRVVSSPYPMAPRWQPDPDFDLSFHVRRVAAASPGTLDIVLEMARIDAMADFDRARPLWRATLVEGLAEGGAALLIKLHHTLSDGIGAVQMAAILFDEGADGERPIGDRAQAGPTRSPKAAFLRDLALGGARALAGSLTMIGNGVRRPIDTAARALSTIGSIYRTVRPIDGPGSSIMLGRSGIRHLAVLRVPLDALHDSGAAAGGTLNDAFIAAVTAGLLRYHVKHGAEPDHFVVCMPLSVRRSSDPIAANRATLMRFCVPAAEMTSAERIRRIHAHTSEARGEKSLAHTDEIAGVLNVLPKGYVSANLRHVDFIASDVPGFTQPLTFAGVPVTMPYAFSPTLGAALNVTLLTYVGQCALGINVDSAAIGDLDLLGDCLRAGFDDVLGRTL